MAIPQGGYGFNGIAETGAFTYAAGMVLPRYFAGEFIIDTGYDDPALWTAGVDAAEVYGARVYARTSTVYPAPAGGTFLGKWIIKAVPALSSDQYTAPVASNIAQRVFIMCTVYVAQPYTNVAEAFQRLDAVDWTLYRI